MQGATRRIGETALNKRRQHDAEKRTSAASVMCAAKLRTWMAISEFEIKRCEKELEKFMEAKRPPVHIRDKVDLRYRITGQSVEIFETRPRFGKPDEKMEEAVAKTTFVKTQNVWKVYWMRQDLKWHSYPPAPEVRYFEEFLDLVREDAHGCFFG